MPRSPLHPIKDRILKKDREGVTMADIAEWASVALDQPITHRQVSHFLYSRRAGYKPKAAEKPKAKAPPKPKAEPGAKVDPPPTTPLGDVPATGRNLQRAIDLLLDRMAHLDSTDPDRVEMADRVLELDMELENRRIGTPKGEP